MSNATPLFPRVPLRRTVAVLSALLLSIGSLVLLAATTVPPAQAAPPSNLSEPIVDQAGVLSGADRQRITEAANQLSGEHGIQLWVVFVDTFDGRGNVEWAQETASASSLGQADVLLAVAVEDQAYYLDGHEGGGVNQSALDDVSSDNVLPALRDSDWTGAAVAAADGLSASLDPSYTGIIAIGAVGGVAVAGAGGAVLVSRRRKHKAVDEGVEALREREFSAEDLARQPSDVLDPWSLEVLTDTDNAIRTSEEELRLAVDEFGATQTAPFTEAVDNAKKGLTASFALRQRLDDNIPETAEERKSMLLQIITTCGDAEAALDAQVESFDEMRNLLINADARFADITQRLIGIRARTERAEKLLSELVSKHGEHTLSSVLPNIEMVLDEVQFAESHADEGRASMKLPVGKQGPAVAAVRAAEGAIEQATKLLDAIDNADSNIAAAQTQMPALIAEVEEELTEAANLTHDGGGALAAAVTTAQQALADARTNYDSNPLGTFTALVDADKELDDALDDARDASIARTRRTEVLRSAISAAEGKIATAQDFVATRRGAIGSTARTRLAEAQRLLDEAHAQPEDKSGTATEHARRAGTLADQALMAAQGDVVSWQQQQPRASNSGGAAAGAGAVLGGILVDSMLRQGMSGGRYRRRGGGGFGGGGFRGGGFGGGGRSPGSFGGSGRSGRIGSGGRF